MITFYEFRSVLNIPLVIFIINCMTLGPLLGEIFCGEEPEKRSYCLVPWCIRTIIISKSLALVLVILLVPIPMLIGSSFFFHSGFQDYVSASLFLITSIPVFLVIGNMVSVLANKQQSGDSSSNLVFHFLMLIIAFIPYLIFKIWLQSALLCLLFCALSLSGWYFYGLPVAENKFRVQYYNPGTV